MKTLSETSVIERRQAIAREREPHVRALESLEREDRDLEAVLRIFAKLNDDDVDGSEADKDVESKGRPDGIPTTREMIFSVLRDDASQGGDGLELPQIIDRVRVNWWPSVSGNDIRPAVWRFQTKENALLRDGDKYRLAGFFYKRKANGLDETEAASAS